MNRLAVTLLVVFTVLVTAAAANAQSSPFTDYRQAAGAQYGGNPPAEEPGDELEEGSGTAPSGDDGGRDRGDGRGRGRGAGGGTGDVALTVNLVFLSPVDPVIVDSVNKVAARLGEPPARVLSLTEPLNLPAIAQAAAGTRYAEISERRLGLVRSLGRDMANELVKPSPFFDRVGPALLTIDVPLRAQKYIVLSRSGGKLATRAATRVRNAFEIGLAQGVRKLRTRGLEIDGERRRRIPSAGVETTQTEPSQIRWYKARKLPSVDNVETVNGQRALYEILRMRAKGHYGVKDTAQRLLPKGIQADPAAATLDGESEAGIGTGVAIGILLLMGAFTTLTAVSRMRRSRSTR